MTTSLQILDGTDPARFPRYVTYLWILAPYRTWIDTATTRDARAGARLADWLARRLR